MTAQLRVIRSRYVDSVVLMRLAQRLTDQEGIDDAAAVMGTDANKTLLAKGGFAGAPPEAGANDLIVAVKSRSSQAAAHALERIDDLLEAPGEADGQAPVRTVAEAVALRPGANIAVVSLPGEYAGAEALRALELGLHVFLFSSNVPLAEEIELKELATSRGLLCMGPDCGTAIVAGKGLGFANAVRRGPVGVVGASGTGIQAVTSLLDRFGVGVSHAIGCGSRDLSEQVGAVTALAGIDALLADEDTEAIVLISKPVAPAVAARLQERAKGAAKPIVFGFLGDPGSPSTLDAVARAAAEAVGIEPPELDGGISDELVSEHRAGLSPSQRFIRGLYAGGTLAYEAQLVLDSAGLDIASNAPLPSSRMLADATRSEGHTIVDLGSEEFTRGRPHPMIDARARRARLLEEARDPEVAVVMLDFVLGYGAARDPAGDLADAIEAAHRTAAADRRELVVLAYVCGTEDDPQNLAAQEETLRAARAVVLPTNAAMARTAARLIAAPAAVRREPAPPVLGGGR